MVSLAETPHPVGAGELRGLSSRGRMRMDQRRKIARTVKRGLAGIVSLAEIPHPVGAGSLHGWGHAGQHADGPAAEKTDKSPAEEDVPVC